MNKRILALLGAGLLVGACNKGTSLQGPVGADASDIVSVSYTPPMRDLNQSFTVSGKAASLSYTYKNYGTPPIGVDVTGNNYVWLSATATSAIRDVVFVTWHYNGSTGANLQTRSGAVSAYKWNGTNYVYTDQVVFNQSEYYELETNLNTGTGRYEVFMVGQRDPDASGYLLSGHGGAVVTRLDYNYITDEFDQSSFKQLPLPGSAATDIVAAAASYYITTGSGIGSDNSSDAQDGGVFKTDYSLTNVSEAYQSASRDDFQAIAIAPGASATDAKISVLEKANRNALRAWTVFDVDNNLNTMGANNYGLGRTNADAGVLEVVGDTASAIAAGYFDPVTERLPSLTDLERFGMVWAQDDSSPLSDANLLIAAGDWGLFTAKAFNPAAPVDTAPQFLANHGYCANVAFDSISEVIYYCAASGGLALIASDNFNGGVLYNAGDFIGKFVPLTGGGLPADPTPYLSGTLPLPDLPAEFVVKEVSLYGAPNGSQQMAIATGEGGVYFVQRN